ncbi:MAG: hypothetical protein JETCAE01_27030 [Anaerolineaceae bacterium]|nr:MAG: hypothetical protein JETCAE01_27030 [Anaerolineaceae bacterium]
MNKIMQEIKKYTYWIPPLQRQLDQRYQAADLAWWREQQPRFLPLPHLLKQEILKRHASEYHLSILVETGTYMGEMVEAMRESFEKVYSIELNEKFVQRARRYFRGRKNVKIFWGDSGYVIGELIKEIDRPTLFWLDGHWSADETARGKKSTPIMEELGHILRARDLRHVILIDDARAFGKSEDYPTMNELEAFVFSLRKNVKIYTEDDIIRILPQ